MNVFFFVVVVYCMYVSFSFVCGYTRLIIVCKLLTSNEESGEHGERIYQVAVSTRTQID